MQRPWTPLDQGICFTFAGRASPRKPVRCTHSWNSLRSNALSLTMNTSPVKRCITKPAKLEIENRFHTDGRITSRCRHLQYLLLSVMPALRDRGRLQVFDAGTWQEHLNVPQSKLMLQGRKSVSANVKAFQFSVLMPQSNTLKIISRRRWGHVLPSFKQDAP